MKWPVFPESSACLAKKHLSFEVFKTLDGLATDSGYTLEKAVRSGIENHDSSMGIYAGDAESYEIFSLIFHPVIREYHNLAENENHISDFRATSLPDPDPENRYIVSTRIRIARNIAGFNFTPHISLRQRSRLEKTIVRAFEALKDEFNPRYFSFEKARPDILHELAGQGLTFRKGDRFQDAAGINSDFPACRGVLLSEDRRLRIWVNEEDHLRIISQENTSDISGAFNRLARAYSLLDGRLEFATHRKYGNLASCPTNIGTAMRAGVHIKLEKLAQSPHVLKNIARLHQLQIRGTSGEKTKIENSVFDISNKRRLGVPETRIIKGLYHGLVDIIKTEKII